MRVLPSQLDLDCQGCNNTVEQGLITAALITPGTHALAGQAEQHDSVCCWPAVEVSLVLMGRLQA